MVTSSAGSGSPVNGVAFFDVDAVADGGFAAVELRSTDVVRFAGDVALEAKRSVTIDAPQIEAAPGVEVRVRATYAVLGNVDGRNQPGATTNRQPVRTPVAGDGTLAVSAAHIDWRGNAALSGFSRVGLSSGGDIRLTHSMQADGATDFTGSIKTTADLVLQAARIYPTTLTAFTVNPVTVGHSYTTGTVTVLPGPTAGGVPLSAGGSLTVNATDIVQGGVLRAPLGQIVLNATNSVTLADGSLTSVSAEGAIIPFGSTQNGQDWIYRVDINGTSRVIAAPPAKRITIDAPDVELAVGSRTDLSGGGDLYAYEFIAGPGGSRDVLDSLEGLYAGAIVPGIGSFGPLDHQYGLGAAVASGEGVYLSGVPGLADGFYTILPARYALLPGAYAIQAVDGYRDIPVGSSIAYPDGSVIVAGRTGFSGTDLIASRTSGYRVTSGATVRTQSGYTESTASAFFTAAADGAAISRLPADAGQLTLAARAALAIDGSIGFGSGRFSYTDPVAGTTTIRTGRGGEVSVLAPKIAVVDAIGAADGFLQIGADSLDRLGAESLILGARRTDTAAGSVLTVGAEAVELRNTAASPLGAPEIILAATGVIAARSGSMVEGRGAPAGSAVPLLVSGDGALLRVSGGAQTTLIRTDVPAGATGTLTIEAGATLRAVSLILDAAADTRILSGATVSARAAGIAASRINVGDVPNGVAGLHITPDLLDGLEGLTDLALRSYSSIAFYGEAGLGTENAEGMPRLASLALEAGALLGYGDGAKTLRAGSIAFSNASNVTCVGCIGDGTGALQLIAGEEGAADAAIVIGSGVKTISGFGGVLFQSSGDVFGAGTGTLGLDAAGDFTLQAARIATSTGADQRIVNADGRVLIATAIASPNAQTHRGIGGKLAIVGTEIEHRGVIALPAGHLTLQATGGAVRLEAGSRVEAAGVIRRIGDVDVLTAAGSVTLVADAGDVRLAETAVIDLSGARTANSSAGGDAGTLIVRVPNGQFVADGDIDGHAIGDGRGGSFALDTLALADFSDLGAVLAAGGFIGDRQLRVRTGDVFITTGDTVQATRFQLSTDGGAITVAGAIDTRGLNGGAIALWARDDLTLLATASLNSTGTDETGEGGDITLGTVQGTIDLGGGTIDLRGGDFGVDGVLTLRAPRTVDNLDVAVAVITADVRTARSIIVEGVRVYDLPSAATLGGSGTLASGNLGFGDPGSASGTGSTLHGDTRTFANAAASATSRIGGTSGTAIQVRAGIEVRGSGDLALVNTFDLRSQDSGADNWRVDGVPVNLTLRSGGDLVFNASLSDGFVAVAGRPVNQWTFAGGDSASYRLVAGADLGAADPAAVLAAPAVGSGNFILTPGNLVRTGNGNIEVAAAGDVRLGYQVGTGTYTQPNAQASVIYTAGVPADTVTPFPMPVNRLRQSLGATYPTDGGDISIVAGRDVVGAPSNQLGTDWQWRRGLVRPDGTINTLGSAGGQNTTWWIAFERFQQGIGALGGGDVEVRAGRDVTNVSVVVPTNGRLAGAVGTLPDAANLVINGGGDITVNAGRDILSGVFQVDRGQARLVAGGTIGSGRVVADTNPVSQDNTPVYPILVLGDASIDVQARADVTIEAAVNGTSLPVTAANRTATGSSYFYTFTSDSRVDLLSVTGDVRLNNNASAIRAIAPDGQWEASNIINLQVYPPNLGVFAVSGSIDVGATRLFPSANADLQLLAAEDVHFSGPLQIYESDVSRVTNPLRPVGNLEGIGVSAIPGRSPEIYLDVVQWPATPLHGADTVPVRIAARAGNIVGNSQAIVLPKPAVLSAGLDITDLRFSGKNLRATDVSLFQAARDIRFEVAKDPDTNRLVANFDGIQVGGPGQVAVLAGGDIDLGNSRGLVTRGNLEDVRLPGAGADLVVGVGFGVGGDGGVQTPALDAFVDRYILGLDTGGIGVAPKRYGAELVRFIAERRGLNPATLTEAQALAMFRDEPEQVRLSFLAGVVYDELHETALAYASSGSYERGYAAISTLFPRDVYRGDLDLFFSQIKTEQGGDINLLVPGGDVTVGIASPPSELLNLKVDRSVDPPVPAAANLGILALSEGAIRGVAKGSFIVNQARILTLQGGNILLWASTGDIDAGKGAKTASAAPPPVIQTDASGNVFVNPSGAVSGSGIGQLLTRSDITAGYVDLIAPLGEVNAGDAGIRVAGDLNIAALRVVGADNIRVGGSTSGVPTGNTGALSGSLSNASSTNEAGRGAVDQMARKLSDAAAETQTLRESFKPSFITVKLFCVGLECTPSLKP
ncbi:MAG: filamentous hemagglutinin family protein [Burkholderiales bacterium]|nr:filamentous hemagglutinin family protein [Burkholderiales bacterium]